MGRSPTTGALLAGAFLAGLGIGGIAFTLLFSQRSGPVRGDSAAAAPGSARETVLRNDPELTRVLHELSATLAAIGPRLDQAPLSNPSGERVPLAATARDRRTDPLAAAIHDLANALARLPVAAPEEPETAHEFASQEDRQHALAVLQLPPAAYVDDEVHTKAQRKLIADHILLTNQTLLDRYGRPNEIWVGENATECWNYEIDMGTGFKEGYNFFVHQGKVVSAECYYDELGED